MKSFEYADEKVSDREIMIAVPSIAIGVGILSLPGDLASDTIASDGWIAIIAGGLIAIFFTWMFAKFAAGFPHQSFFSYSSLIVTKPVAVIISFFFSVIWVGVAAFEVRRIADVSSQYLFDHTPVEVISLTFLLVVVYAVSGTRVGLLRLNMMFLPIIILISCLAFAFNLGNFEPANLRPVFETSLNGYVKGIHTGVISYVGFTIVLFYMGLVDKPKHAPRKAALGMVIPIILYCILFVMCIGVLGHSVTENFLYPTIELAKGFGLFERFESIFFVIWIMAIFNTTSMALDVAVMAINSIFKKVRKVTILFILSPIIYLIGMFPQNFLEVSALGSLVSNTALVYAIAVTMILIIIAKLRGVKRVG